MARHLVPTVAATRRLSLAIELENPAPVWVDIPLRVELFLFSALALHDPNIQNARPLTERVTISATYSINLDTLPTPENCLHFQPCLAAYCRDKAADALQQRELDAGDYWCQRRQTKATFNNSINDHLNLENDTWEEFLWRLRSRSYDRVKISQELIYVPVVHGRETGPSSQL